jgi:hypothetical protein
MTNNIINNSTNISAICECINSSDKYEIDQIVTEDIDEIDNRLAKIRNIHKDLTEFGANPDELIKRYEHRKSKLKNLLLKVRNTPECK